MKNTMKKIISLAICAIILCLFCMPVYAYSESEVMEQAKNMVRLAKSAKEDEEYMYAGQYYYCAGSSFATYPKFYSLAAYAYKWSAEAYHSAHAYDDETTMLARQNECEGLALEYQSIQVSVNEVFSGDTLIESGGFILSDGNIAIIVGVAAAVIFGLGGFFIGKTAEKKKPALASGAENKGEE